MAIAALRCVPFHTQVVSKKTSTETRQRRVFIDYDYYLSDIKRFFSAPFSVEWLGDVHGLLQEVSVADAATPLFVVGCPQVVEIVRREVQSVSSQEAAKILRVDELGVLRSRYRTETRQQRLALR